ncbi:MAG: hypothetical protein ACW98F_12800 [Candidatus Hodarchaeales archaeon]|jgi:ABC-type transport system involved in multi-copper enzyme maturation permease subunit
MVVRETWFIVRNSLIIAKYETKRYLFSNRSLILLIFCLVPTLLYVSFAGQNASLEIYLHLNGYEWFVGHVLQIYITFAYVINILVSIVVIQELFPNESALEVLFTSTKRSEVFIGKVSTTAIVLLFTSLCTWIGCVISFLIWQQELPISLDRFLLALVILLIVSMVPLMVTVFGNTLVMKYRSLSGMGSGFPIIVFFVIPFFIFSSIYLGFATEEMLQFSTYFRVYIITNHMFMTQEEQISTFEEVNEAFRFFGIIFVLALILSWFFFLRMETRKKD